MLEITWMYINLLRILDFTFYFHNGILSGVG